MNRNTFNLTVTETTAVCPVGETTGRENAATGATPVLSCEGPCIRGEIARLAANRLAKEPGFRRACHGELLTAPHSTMAQWVKGADRVVVIDGCHMKCHARVIENIVPRTRIRGFDAVGHYRKFGDVFDIDAVPEAERQAISKDVADWVLGKLKDSRPTLVSAGSAPCASTGTSTASHTPPSMNNNTNSCQSGSDQNTGDATSLFTTQVAEFVAIAAAIGANCEPCLRHHVREAERCGISHDDINRAVAFAAQVKATPHRNILALAERLTANASGDSKTTASSCCG